MFCAPNIRPRLLLPLFSLSIHPSHNLEAAQNHPRGLSRDKTPHDAFHGETKRFYENLKLHAACGSLFFQRGFVETQWENQRRIENQEIVTRVKGDFFGLLLSKATKIVNCPENATASKFCSITVGAPKNICEFCVCSLVGLEQNTHTHTHRAPLPRTDLCVCVCVCVCVCLCVCVCVQVCVLMSSMNILA